MRLPFGNSQHAHVDAGLLSAYLDGQVARNERLRIEAHLGSCIACQRELASLHQTVTMLQALPRVAVPRAFTLSEVQVGILRPAGQPAWLGGLLRGMAAVSALALVAVIAAVLLGRPGWEPPQFAASLPAPAPTTIAAVAKAQPAQETKLPEVIPATAPQAPSAAASNPLPATKAPEPTAIPAIEKPAVKMGAASTQAAAVQSDKAAAPAAAAPPPAPALQPTASKPAMAAAAPSRLPVPTPTAAPPMLARGAPEAGAAKVSAEDELSTAASGDLPAHIALTYTDGHAVWALDRSGARQLVGVENATGPVLSSDRAWIAYRLGKDDGAEVWVVPWSGGAARLLVTEQALNAELPPGYRERRIQEFRWVPGQRWLMVAVLAVPVDQGASPRLELWSIHAETGERLLLANTDPGHRAVASPDGALLAFFRREPDKAAEGSLWVAGTDGAGERAVLRFPAQGDQRAYDGQISWLPDSSVFWAAIPDTDLDRPQRLNGLTLYRVPVKGEAQPVAHIEAHEAYWSPDGARLAYTRLTGDVSGPRELYLAGADGSAPQLYATISSGRVIGWSPDSARLLYEDAGQLVAGTPGQKAQRLATGASAPRWIDSGQILYLADGVRQWTLLGLDGKTTRLSALPADAAFDCIVP